MAYSYDFDYIEYGQAMDVGLFYKREMLLDYAKRRILLPSLVPLVYFFGIFEDMVEQISVDIPWIKIEEFADNPL